MLKQLNVQELNYFRSSYEILRSELVSDKEIRTVLEHGWVVDAQPDWIILLGYVNVGGKYIAVHVKLSKTIHENDEGWYISHAYYPTKDEWGSNYTEKICFCIKADNRKAMVG